MWGNKFQVLAFSLVFLMCFSISAQASKPAEYMQVFPFGADDFIMYAMAFMPALDLTIKNLVVTGVLTANETHFINTTVEDVNVTRNMTVQHTLIAKNISIGDGTFLVDSAGNLETSGKATVGDFDSTTEAQLVVRGGAVGSPIISLQRTVGAVKTFDWALTGGYLTFNDKTATQIAMSMSGAGSVSRVLLGGHLSSASAGPHQGDGYLTGVQPGGLAEDLAGSDVYIASGRGRGAPTSKLTFQTPIANATDNNTLQLLDDTMVLVDQKVGIGTPEPNATVHVVGGDVIVNEKLSVGHGINPVYEVSVEGLIAAYDGLNLTLTGPIGDTGYMIALDLAEKYIPLIVGGSPIYFQTGPDVLDGTVMTLLGSNLGINTLEPNATAHVAGDAIVDDNLTAENVWLPTYCFAHTADTQNITGAGVWLNVSFDEEASLCTHMTHTYSDSTNNTFTIQDDGVYDITYHLTFSDTAPSPSGHVEMRIIRNATEIAGSALEEDSSKQYNDFTIGNGVIAALTADDRIIFQFTGDDTTIGMSVHAAYADHRDTGVIKIRRIG